MTLMGWLERLVGQAVAGDDDGASVPTSRATYDLRRAGPSIVSSKELQRTPDDGRFWGRGR